MVIIRANRELDGMQMEQLILEVNVQALRGVIVLPPWCELLSEAPAPEGIQIVQQKEDARVAELEKELAAALAHIYAAKDCETCKHYGSVQPCPGDCACCWHVDCGCKTCHHGSNWEWRHGRESV